MPERELILYVDQQGKRLVNGPNSTRTAPAPEFIRGDGIPIKVRILKESASNERRWDDAGLTDQNIRVGIGTPGGTPTSGEFTLTYGGDTTSSLAYNASASAVETALNALASITSAGGVTVAAVGTGGYRVTFNTAGARTDFSADSTALYPTSSIVAFEAITGDGSTREVAIIKIEAEPAAYVELTATLDAAGSSISTIREGAAGVGDIQQFELTPEPFDGSYFITIGSAKSAAIQWDATAEEIQTAIEALSGIGAGNVTVTGEFPLYTATFDASLTDVSEMTIDASGLVVPTGRQGTLNTNTAGFVELLAGAADARGTLEVEIYDTNNSTSYTVLQTTCIALEDLIGNTPSSQTPLPTYLTTSTSGVTLATMLGLTTYADLTAANAAEVPGIPYWDTALGRINVTTA